MDILERVDLLCEERNVSRRQVALACGMDASAISKWKGRSPSAKSIKAVADYFDVDSDWLLGKSDVRKNEQRIYYTIDDSEIDTQKLSDKQRAIMSAVPDLASDKVDVLYAMIEQMSGNGNE